MLGNGSLNIMNIVDRMRLIWSTDCFKHKHNQQPKADEGKPTLDKSVSYGQLIDLSRLQEHTCKCITVLYKCA